MPGRSRGREKKDPGIKMTFQVAEVKKPLIAVKRIPEKGNNVSFGPGREDNYIENKKTGMKIPMRETGKGSYVIDMV